MMFKEEFQWKLIESKIIQINDISIVGEKKDERSSYFSNLWQGTNCLIIEITPTNSIDKVNIKILKSGVVLYDLHDLSLLGALTELLSNFIGPQTTITVDLSSLDNNIIMVICNILISELKPLRFFATYAEPQEYVGRNVFGNYQLSAEVKGIYDVPTFIRRGKNKDIELIAFLGFEGKRLRKIIEDQPAIRNVTPVIGFPSFSPGWQARALANSMDVLSHTEMSDIFKCEASSIYSAFETIMGINKIVSSNTQLALSPLGTRPHTAACALYAALNKDTLILYDHVVELSPRSEGILTCKGYNLTPFIKMNS